MTHSLRLHLSLILCLELFSCGGPPLHVGEITVSAAASPTAGDSMTQAAAYTASTAASPFREELAKDTWTYLQWAISNHLPWSWKSETISGGDYANTAEIGLYALCWLAAYDLQRAWSPTWSQTEAEVSAVFDQLRAWQTGSQSSVPNGPNAYQNSAFYQWYWVSWSPPVVGAGSGDHLVPSIDNAWLAASLITIQQYALAHNHPELAQKAAGILGDMDFMLWYHADVHRFTWGAVDDPQGGGQADYYSNENRLINFIARALDQLSEAEFRQSLAALNALSGTYETITVEKVSYDGSYFTYTAPALFFREMDLPYGTRTIIPATQAQILYAQNQGYQAWGLSDCFDVNDGGYVQQGAPPAAAPGSPEPRSGLVTPHASALALITPLEGQAEANLQTIDTLYTCAYHDQYGFVDSVITLPSAADYGQCSSRFSTLEQAWIFLSIANAENGFVWNNFYRHPGVLRTHAELIGDHRAYLPLMIRER